MRSRSGRTVAAVLLSSLALQACTTMTPGRAEHASIPATTTRSAPTTTDRADTTVEDELADLFGEIDEGLMATSDARFEYSTAAGSPEGRNCWGTVTFDGGWTDGFDVECSISGTAVRLLQVDGIRYLSSPQLDELEPAVAGTTFEWLQVGEVDLEAGLGLHYQFNQVDHAADASWLVNLSQWAVSLEQGPPESGASGEVRVWTMELDTASLVSDVQETIVQEWGCDGDTTPAPEGSKSFVDIRLDPQGRLVSLVLRGTDAVNGAIEIETTMGWSSFDEQDAPQAPDPATVYVPSE